MVFALFYSIPAAASMLQVSLAVPGAAIGGRCRLGLADRCAKKSSLYPPQAARGFKSRQTKRKAPHFRAGLFLAEKEGFEPSRRFPDLRP